MVKLTPELINQSMQYINPCRERELDLRGYKIPQIENLGATLDQFDTIDLSDNDLRKLDNLPHLPRLKCLLLNNNRILRISEGLEEAVPNLGSIILTGNNLQELSDLEPWSDSPSWKPSACLSTRYPRSPTTASTWPTSSRSCGYSTSGRSSRRTARRRRSSSAPSRARTC